MNTPTLKLTDLVPRQAVLILSAAAQPLTLSAWSLRVRAWALEKYGAEKLQKILDSRDIVGLADIAWFMVKEKELFDHKIENFLDSILTAKDHINLITAVLESIGLGEPELREIENAMLKAVDEVSDPNAQSPNRKTKIGAKRSSR